MKLLYFFILWFLFSFNNHPEIPPSHEVLDPECFRETHERFGIHTWWHWIDGNITKEGIQKDLEAMSKQGITQVTILNVGLYNKQFFGLDNIQFNSPEWYNMFQFAIKKADSLDLKIGVHNCDGWSTSGGPWIDPEHSMKEVTWSSSLVDGGELIVKSLAKPFSREDFYRDVAVIAIRSDRQTNSFAQAMPEISINGEEIPNHISDGCPVGGITVKKGDTISIVFSKAFVAEKIVIHPRKSFVWGSIDGVDNSTISYTLEGNSFDNEYKKLDRFTTRGFNKTQIIEIPRIKTRSLRIIIDSIENTESFSLGELEFLKDNEIPSYTTEIPWHQAKSASVQGSLNTRYCDPDGYRSDPIPIEYIVDLTNKINDSGILHWDAPAGRWELIRFGYTTTGTTNRPATVSGTGLECDKMDTIALNWHYAHFPAKLVEQAGEFTGNTFKFLLLDSWECYFQNWTQTFPEEFEKLNGYSLCQWIPVICGRVVESVRYTESFLYDFRRTIAELIGKNYYKHFADLSHRDGLELHGEVIYGGIKLPSLDVLKAYSYTDVPMYEFWARPDNNMLYGNKKLPEDLIQFAASAGLFYGKPVIGAEAYTGYASYSASPWDLKPYGDIAFCSGINQMILHSYVHQPVDTKPGLTLQNFGHSFNRNNTFWNKIRGWLKFQSRIQYLLQKTDEANDILYYVGDALPQNNINPTQLPDGYKFNICNLDILENKTYVENHKIKTEEGSSFSLLVLPDQDGINYSTLVQLEKLIRKGAYMYGRKPFYMYSLSDIKLYSKEFEELTDRLWGGENQKDTSVISYGKGKIFQTMPLSDVFKTIDLTEDFKAESFDSTQFIFSHRTNGATDAYFVANQLDQPAYAHCRFRSTGKSVEIWNPLTGEISALKDTVLEQNSTYITRRFEPLESLFFIFRNENDSVEYRTESRELAVYIIAELKGSIEFHPAYKGYIKPVQIEDLQPLTDFKNPDIKYFAGQAKYNINFPFYYSIDSTTDWFINIGDLEATASVTFNDHFLDDVWSPLQDLPVNNILKTGNNRLEITVDIPYRNRFIGDFNQYGNVRSLWTSCEIGNYLHTFSPLKPSGPEVPVKIISKTK